MTIGMTSGNPLYRELADRLRSDIDAGAYEPGDRMPSEPALVESTGYSRSTVRKALQTLVDEGYITKAQGKGTFVADTITHEQANEALAPTFLSFTDNARSLGVAPSTRTVDVRAVSPTPGLAKFFGISQDSNVFEVTRLRSIDEEPVMLETTWLPMAYSDLSGSELDGSLYEALRSHFGVEPSTGTKSIGICNATSREAFQLGVPKGTALMLLEDHVYDQHGAPLHVSKQVVLGNKYQYTIRMPHLGDE